MISSMVNTFAVFFVIVVAALVFLARAFKSLGEDNPAAQAEIKKHAAEAGHLLLSRFVNKK